MKIKNEISSFGSYAKTLYNAEGSFGRQNLIGSCTNPKSGSLFSPLGHVKGATSAVGNIAGSMTDILSLSNGIGSCYSTNKNWAIEFPLVSNPNSFFCADNTGVSKMSAIPLTGIVCK
jgi:hypothetical protein